RQRVLTLKGARAMSAYETLLLAIMRADREVQDRRDRQEITYASLRQRRRHCHDGRALIGPKRIDHRVGERVEPAAQVGLQLATGGEGSFGAARIHDEKDLIGGSHQISL